VIPSGEHSRPVILVADDEPFVLRYIKQVLQLANYDVITVDGVDEAWTILDQQHSAIDLVLTDVVMPGSINGLELAERIHQLDADLPVLFITGALSESDPRTAKMAEKQLALMKPFYPKQLVDFVSAQLRGASSGIVR
jgi:DNA-binding response OmpR family regulator